MNTTKVLIGSGLGVAAVIAGTVAGVSTFVHNESQAKGKDIATKRYHLSRPAIVTDKRRMFIGKILTESEGEYPGYILDSNDATTLSIPKDTFEKYGLAFDTKNNVIYVGDKQNPCHKGTDGCSFEPY